MKNPNSLNAKLYCWFYGITPYNLPKNLCPYVWNSLIAWILVIPYTLYNFLLILIDEVLNKNYKNGDNSFIKRLGLSTFFYLVLGVLFLLVNVIVSFFIHYDEKSIFSHLLGPGLMFLTVIIIFGCYELSERLINKIKGIKKEPYILFSYIKAKYEKNCPIIDWDYKKIKD